MNNRSQYPLPSVVIVGGGFGGLEAAKRLRRAACKVTLIDRRNYHLFQPLLYQVATGTLSPANIASPLRVLLRKANCEILLGSVSDVDPLARTVRLSDSREVPYDVLILAVGARTGYFGRDDWRYVAPGLKSLEDATEIRRRIFHAFEAAEWEPDAAEREAWMTFVIVGGGPTGTELAGALSDIARHTLRRDFHHINPSDARILLVEAGPRVLSPFSEKSSARAEQDLRKLGVEVRTGAMVTAVDEATVTLQTSDPSAPSQRIATRTVIWAAGVEANPLAAVIAQRTGASRDRSGRIVVAENLTLPGHDDLFVIGDLASCDDGHGRPLPGLAPVAMQQGAYVAQSLTERWSGRTPSAFRYRDRGTMAVIGRWQAVARLGQHSFHGVFAWLLWLVIHVMQINRLENRFLVMTQWAVTFLTRNRSARIITEPAADRSAPRPTKTT